MIYNVNANDFIDDFVCFCMNCIGQDKEKPIIDYDDFDLKRLSYIYQNKQYMIRLWNIEDGLVDFTIFEEKENENSMNRIYHGLYLIPTDENIEELEKQIKDDLRESFNYLVEEANLKEVVKFLHKNNKIENIDYYMLMRWIMPDDYKICMEELIDYN